MAEGGPQCAPGRAPQPHASPHPGLHPCHRGGDGRPYGAGPLAVGRSGNGSLPLGSVTSTFPAPPHDAPSALSPPLSADPDRVGPYRVVGRLGAGGMGVVYAGLDADGVRAAVKVVRAEIAEDTGFRARFRREADVLARVHGPGLVPLLAADPDAERPWLATAYVPGPTLQQYVDSYGPPRRACCARWPWVRPPPWRRCTPPASCTATSSPAMSSSVPTGRVSWTSASHTHWTPLPSPAPEPGSGPRAGSVPNSTRDARRAPPPTSSPGAPSWPTRPPALIRSAPAPPTWWPSASCGRSPT